jgi:hypothetical protein
MADTPSELPPELRPESEEDHQRRLRTMWLGIGVPTLIAGVLAWLLGVPWWIVLMVILGVGAGIFFST